VVINGIFSRSASAHAKASAKEIHSSTLMPPTRWIHASSASRRRASGRARVLVDAV
jgi:hypothetical protein